MILAEAATQLYRDSGYPDLISFEEDIARIASIVLVIAESPGSLAELGAFASVPVICENLRVIVQEAHSDDESFIRYGPIERVRLPNEGERVGVFPWRTHKNGQIVISSAAPHYSEMTSFIESHLGNVHSTQTLSASSDHKLFYVISWIVFVSSVISAKNLYDAVISLMPEVSRKQIRNKLYCLKLAGWIGMTPYSGKQYYFSRYDIDPFDRYAFREGVADNDAPRRKSDVTAALMQHEVAPEHVRSRAMDGRVK